MLEKNWHSLISEDEFLHRAARMPLQRIKWSVAERNDIEIRIRRDDLIDSNLSGNKFYKLFYNMHAAKAAGYKTILSFGGAWSNHLYALAAAGRDIGFATIGVIRGERPRVLSATLQDAENWGMKLHFISRSMYREKNSEELVESLKRECGDFYLLPEGGDNQKGIQGTRVIGSSLRQQLKSGYTAVCVACGTGNTLAGIASGLGDDGGGQVTGFSVLKGEGGLGKNIGARIDNIKVNNWRLISGFHGGGYGKKLPSILRDFRNGFESETQLILDPVYTLKMSWGVATLIEQHYWPRGSRIVLVHTGGLQGRRGFSV